MADDEAHFTVNFGTGQTMNLDEIRARRQAFMPDGEHAWVISTIFALDDPEQALDDMELVAENFIGVAGISCLICGERYLSLNRHFKCPQQQPSSTSPPASAP